MYFISILTQTYYISYCFIVLQLHHSKRLKIRPVGTALSPNGIGLPSSSEKNALSLAAIDHVVVDKNRGLVTVGAGARVSTVLAELKKVKWCVFFVFKVYVKMVFSFHFSGIVAKQLNIIIIIIKHGLTLQNFSSIQEQQLAGWTQVAAHGTGIVEQAVLTLVIYYTECNSI